MNSAANASTSTTEARALVLHADDNVATALCALDTHAHVRIQGPGSMLPVDLREPIALCHKFALRAIAKGDAVTKYGESIGRATRAIEAGEHVHTHNLVSTRAR